MRRKFRIRPAWLWTAAIIAAGGSYYLWQQQSASARAAELPKGVQTGKAVRGDLSRRITATGVISAQIGAKVNIGSEITGRIRRLPADVGTRVKKGQLVAELDSPDLEAQVRQQQQNVQAMSASLAQAQSRLAQALLGEELSKEQTRTQIEEAKYSLAASRARLGVAEAADRMQPTQTSAEIARAEAAVSTARSEERQVLQTVNQQILQAQAALDDAEAVELNLRATRRRKEALLVQGFISAQEVEDTRAQHVQALARVRTQKANLQIVREKTAADLQATRDRVLQAEATLEAARSSRLQDAMRAAEKRSAEEAVRQAEATLALRQSNRTQDRIRRRDVEEARAAVDHAKASLAQAQALLRYQQARLDKARIYSPIDGTVLTITAQQGETIAAGLAAPTLITVADLDRLEVRAYVDETDIGKVRLGLPAEVRVDAFPDRVFRGRVAKIASASTVKDNVITYETTVELLEGMGRLLPDMTADVTLILGRTTDALLVPSEAVHRGVGETVVYVLHRGKTGPERVEKRSVRTGADDGSQIQILSGLTDGDEVVLAGLQRLGVTAIDAQQGPPQAGARAR